MARKQIGRTDLAMAVERLQRIAQRLSEAPAVCEQAALKHKERHHPYREEAPYAHQVGGLQETCTSTAADIALVIKLLGGGSGG